MMICEKCERIGRLNKIPHHIEIGEDGIAEVDCPWEWKKEEIETYVKALGLSSQMKTQNTTTLTTWVLIMTQKGCSNIVGL